MIEGSPPASPSALHHPDGEVMTRWDAFRALCVARFREVYRESEVVFWSFIFPIVLSLGLGVAFRNRPLEVLRVAVLEAPGAEGVAEALRTTPLLKTEILTEAAATSALRMGKVALIVDPAGPVDVTYRLDPSRPESVLARTRVDDALERAAGRRDLLESRDQEVAEPGARYIDFLIPGLIGMNLMSGGMWGIGFNLVDMRIKRLLKRLMASPLRRGDFLASQLTVRLLFMFVEVSFLLLFGHLVFGVPVRASLPAVYLVGAGGALCFGGLGLLVASRARRIETVTGLMNAVMTPMFVFSGIFFSVERFPDRLQPLIRVLPLTALIDAFRALILEGATLADQTSRLVLLGLWGGVSFLIGLRLFRWS